MGERWPSMGVLVGLFLLVGCTSAPGAPTVEGAVAGADERPSTQEAPGDEEAMTSGGSTADDVAAVLHVDVVLDDDATVIEPPRLLWVFTSRDGLPAAPTSAGGDVARLLAADDRLLAEAPAERFEVMADCAEGASCPPRVGLSSTLTVPDGADLAARLELIVGGELLAAVDRGADVAFLELDLPEPGDLTPPATVSWRATGGEVYARLVPEPGASPQGGATSLELSGPPTGSLRIEAEHLYPGDGAVLEVVVADGLAFERVVTGPYRSAVPLPVEWRVVSDRHGPLDELEVLEHDTRQWAYLLLRVNVYISAPGGGSRSADDVRARWISDRDGDLAEVNLEEAPDLYVPSSALTPGHHALTLHLEVDGVDGPARHTIEVALDVAD
jgi:hypothetical protein